MHVQKRNNNVSIYCLSSGSTLPEWLSDHQKRNILKNDEGLRRRIELLQDFTMPTSSTKIIQSYNHQYIVVAGTYQPRIKCYDIYQLSCKYERYIPSDCIDMTMLSSYDDSKFALLCNDRTIQFHAPYGKHETIRIPTFGRAMTYETTSCSLYVAAKGNSLYNIHLQDGRFYEPYQLNNNNNHSSSSSPQETVSGTSIAVHPLHPLLTVGCDDGIVRFYDNRVGSYDTTKGSKHAFLHLNVYDATKGYGYYDNHTHTATTQYPGEITSIAHDSSTGLYMAFGMLNGCISLYDIRSSKPLYIQEHKNGTAIHTIHFHPTSGHILSSDEKLIKIWKYKKSSLVSDRTPNGNETHVYGDLLNDSTLVPTTSNDNNNDIGSVMVNVESTSKLSHFMVAGDENDSPMFEKKSGLLLCATDQPKMESYYIPALGIAPKWCNFLDSITEELEERDLQRTNTTDSAGNQTNNSNYETVFDNYKFITNDEIDILGISNLIGTPLLRGYMHGFFIHMQLYNRLRAVVNPFEYEDYQKKKVKDKINMKQSSRITPKENRDYIKSHNHDNENNNDKTKELKASNNNAKVNIGLANRLMMKASSSLSSKDTAKKLSQLATNLLSDDRFSSLFTNPDYEIDMNDETFLLRNPSGMAAMKQKKDNLDSDDEFDDEEEDDENDAVNHQPQNNWNDDDDDDNEDNDDDDDDNDGEDHESGTDDDDDVGGFDGVKIRGDNYREMKMALRGNPEKQQRTQKSPSNSQVMKKKNIPKLLDDSDDEMNLTNYYDSKKIDNSNGSGSKQSTHTKKKGIMNVPLAERLQAKMEEGNNTTNLRHTIRVTSSGSKEMTYIPTSNKSSTKTVSSAASAPQDNKSNKKQAQRDRRGINELGLKKQKMYHSRHHKK